MTDRLVSVIIPAYNAAPFLAEAIESVLSQTHQNLELIICNDGSTDSTLSIAQTYQKKDRRVRILDFENCGKTAAFNKGLAISKGELIARMDADDIMMPNRIRRQVEYLSRHSDVHGVSCFAYYIGPKGNIFGRYTSNLLTVDDCRRLRERQEYAVPLNTGFTTWREPFLDVGGYTEHIKTADDVDMFNRYIESGYNIVSLPEYLMKYRIHNASTMFTSYRKNATYVEYIKECMRLRRAGRPEISFDEYVNKMNGRSLWERVERNRKIYSSMLYRNSGYYLATGAYLKLFLSLAGSMALDPGKSARKLMRQVKLKFK